MRSPSPTTWGGTGSRWSGIRLARRRQGTPLPFSPVTSECPSWDTPRYPQAHDQDWGKQSARPGIGAQTLTSVARLGRHSPPGTLSV